ncbi:hypothetical protein V501_03089 [Pseudogymnoascus sp. VKM F-4519 (FW-2642)]|nr:hypothetical protein V501_03089 [Pseudogymnoascus sp. VKM F-4519 (FW-2642)]
MVSLSRSSSASPEPSETMQIFIKNLSGDIIPLTVPVDISLSHIKTLLSLRTSLPTTSLNLVHAGKHLPSSAAPLTAHGIKPESTLHLVVPMRGGMPPKKIRCTHKECKEVAQRIVGDCGFCNGHFCGRHRLLEDHKCTGLEDVSCSPSDPGCGVATAAAVAMATSPSSDSSLLGELCGGDSAEPQWWLCKKESHDRNAAQLNSERTTVIKGI